MGLVCWSSPIVIERWPCGSSGCVTLATAAEAASIASYNTSPQQPASSSLHEGEATTLDVTEEQWTVLEPLIGELPRRADGRGRPWRSSREVLNGMLWILHTGAQWADLPERYPPYQTCHRRFQRWSADGTLERVLGALATDLKERGGLDLSECFIDGTFIVAKKGAAVWEKPSGAKVRNSWQWQTALVFLSPCVPPRLRLTRSVWSPPRSTHGS